MELWGRRDKATRAKLRGWAWLTCCSHRQSFTVAKLSSVLKLQAVPSPPSREQATAAARDIVINFRFSSVYGTVINPHYAGTATRGGGLHVAALSAAVTYRYVTLAPKVGICATMFLAAAALSARSNTKLTLALQELENPRRRWP